MLPFMALLLTMFVERHPPGPTQTVPQWVRDVASQGNPRFTKEDGFAWTFAYAVFITHIHALFTQSCSYCRLAKEYYEKAKCKNKALASIAVAQRWRNDLVFKVLLEGAGDVHYVCNWPDLACFAVQWQLKCQDTRKNYPGRRVWPSGQTAEEEEEDDVEQPKQAKGGTGETNRCSLGDSALTFGTFPLNFPEAGCVSRCVKPASAYTFTSRLYSASMLVSKSFPSPCAPGINSLLGLC
jgi:hypothetical protein